MEASKYLYFEVTRSCNERCVQCFNNSGRRLPGELGSDAAVDLIRRFRLGGGCDLQLTGGEIFSKPGIDDLLNEVAGMGFERLTLSTNGTLLNSRRLQWIGDTVHECDISLDGFSDTHDVLRGLVSFDKTVRAIRDVAQLKNVRVHVCTCVSRPLLARIREFLDFLMSLGVQSVKLALIEDIGRGNTDRSWMIPKPEHHKLYWEFERLRSAYASKILVEQSLSLSPILPSVAVDGLVCDPRGFLYPMIGNLPGYWIVGRAHPHFEIDEGRLASYIGEAQLAIEGVIESVAAGNPVNWWNVIHRHLDAVARNKVAA